MLSFFKSSTDKGGNKTKIWIILIGAVAGVLLLLWGNNGTSKTEVQESTSLYRVEEDELILYQAYLQNEIKALCATVSGVGDPTVIVTLSGGFSSEYATEWEDGNESYVILGSGSAQSALFLSRSAPRIAGIGVVCQGGANAGVKKELTALLSAAFDLPSNRIYITQAKQ